METNKKLKTKMYVQVVFNHFTGTIETEKNVKNISVRVSFLINGKRETAIFFFILTQKNKKICGIHP